MPPVICELSGAGLSLLPADAEAMIPGRPRPGEGRRRVGRPTSAARVEPPAGGGGDASAALREQVEQLRGEVAELRRRLESLEQQLL